ncbi:MAG: DUF2844 domain-containing protein [Thiobacillaceae bacterium]|jgi:hypothetical protein
MSLASKLLLVFCAAVSIPACAELGGDESGISSDAAVTRMQLRAVVRADTRYRVHELRDAASDVSVREYVNPDGKVFGVAWDGPTKPDLSQVLGPYFTRYTSAATGHGLVRRLRSIDQPDFVLRVSGHMRHFIGSAWVPNLIPANVDPAEVK